MIQSFSEVTKLSVWKLELLETGVISEDRVGSLGPQSLQQLLDRVGSQSPQSPQQQLEAARWGARGSRATHVLRSCLPALSQTLDLFCSFCKTED